jgi:flagellar FliL protein
MSAPTSPSPEGSPKTDAAKTQSAPKRPRRTLVAIVGGVLLLAGLGAGGFFFWSSRASAAQPDHAQSDGDDAATPAKAPGLVALEPFVVNLADRETPRFLRVTLRLLVDGKEHAEEVVGDQVAIARVRSTILDVLSTQVSDRLVTPEGRGELRKRIAERASEVLHDTKVIDVLFTDFVVQF